MRVASTFLLGILLFGSPASAGEGEPVVVDVAPAAAPLGADTLRRQIGEELQAPAIAPDDPRAGDARGTVKVDVEDGELTVSYASRGMPIVRRVPLPQDPAAGRREATVLAGNLARDEAGEIAATLRQLAPPQPPDADRVESERMHRIVAYHAEIERRERVIAAWAWLLGGAAIAASGTYVVVDRQQRGENALLGALVITTGGLSMALSALFLTLPTAGPLERLAMRDPRESSEDSAAQWSKAARNERTTRSVEGWFTLVFAASLGVFGSTMLTSSLDRPTREGVSAVAFVAGGLVAYEGVHDLLTPGPVETALRSYERESGRPIMTKESARPRLQLGFVRNGVIAGVGGAF